MEQHFAPAMEVFDLEFDEIDGALGGNWQASLWGCAFEDFLTRRFGEEDENPVEAYLRRCGYRASVASRGYMSALKSSVMSLYEVSDIVPGRSLRARDLIRGGQPVLVSERSATQSLKSWDHIAARIVPEGDKMMLGGGLLPFTPEGSEGLFRLLRDTFPHTFKGRRKPRPSPDGLVGWIGSDDDLRQAAPLFTSAWLFEILPQALEPQTPTLLNSEGDEVVFHTVRFAIPKHSARKEIVRRLNAVAGFSAESRSFWNWLEEPTTTPTKPGGKKGFAWNITMDDGVVVLGNLELKPGAITLSVNSAARAERGRRLLAATLGDLVGPSLTEIETVDQMLAARPARDAAPEPDIPLEVQEQLVHAMLDKQYRAMLDEPIPVLGSKSPRTAARSAKGRADLVDWLKLLENRSQASGDRSDPMTTYDFGWMWRVLNIEHLRR